MPATSATARAGLRDDLAAEASERFKTMAGHPMELSTEQIIKVISQAMPYMIQRG